MAVYTLYGVIMSYLLIKLILARIVKMEFHIWDPIVLLPVIGAYFAVFVKHSAFITETQLFGTQRGFCPTHILLLIMSLPVGLFVVAVFMHLHMDISIIHELTACVVHVPRT